MASSDAVMTDAFSPAAAAAPFSSPPGLEPRHTDNGAADTVTALLAVEGVEARLIEAVRQAVLQDVDRRVAERTDDMWKRARAVLQQVQTKQKVKTDKLNEDVQRCHERQGLLEGENMKLSQQLTVLNQKFALLGQVLAGAGSQPHPSMAALSSHAAASPEGEGGLAAQLAPGTPKKARTGDPASSSLFAGSLAPTHAAVSPLLLTPTFDAALLHEGKLPSVPAFPFASAGVAAADPPAATTVSLADALAATDVSSSIAPANAAPAGPRLPLSLAASLKAPDDGVKTFTFTLRKADGAELGLDVSHNDQEKVLRVEGVRPDGAVEAWNRQCAGGGAASERAVRSADKIVSVNDVQGDPQAMLEECRDRRLLKLTIVRGAGTITASKLAGGPSTLRAEASVFVPMSSPSTSASDSPAAPGSPSLPTQASSADAEGESAAKNNPEKTPETERIAKPAAADASEV